MSLTGLNPFLKDIVAGIPSASGLPVECSGGNKADRPDLTTCSWPGLAPSVGAPKNWSNTSPLPPQQNYSAWIQFNSTKLSNSTILPTKYGSNIVLLGSNTKNCRIYFDSPVHYINITGGAEDKRLPSVQANGTTELRLWSRSWQRAWDLTVGWNDEPGLDGRVACEWNDEGGPDAVPALAEARRAIPSWATISKTGDGLVEGFKRFMI